MKDTDNSVNPYLDYVKSIQAALDAAQALRAPEQRRTPPASDACVLLFSPHPDDECITGTLPLRLMREADKRIVNVPVTFGSRQGRRAERARELDKACAFLGWEIYSPSETREPLTADDLAEAMHRFQPETIFMPHENDWNPRHVSTHECVVDALKQLGDSFACNVVETEFWHPMTDPNLMVEADAETVADLTAAVSLHAGEVARNPYHLLLPAWMQDNVRRGSERLGGIGTPAAACTFATLYRLRTWRNGAFSEREIEDRIVPVKSSRIHDI